MSRSIKASLLGLAAMSLAACTTTPTGDQNAPAEPVGAAAKEPASTMDLSSVQVPALAAYLGQGPGYLTGLFGTPTLRRQEAGVELWQYAGPTCVVLFYLYGDAADELAIEHLEARMRDGGAPADDATLCLKEVAATKSARPVT